MYGMPRVPPAAGPLPEHCADWPEVWTGLCVRAADEGERRCGDALPCCEDVYFDRFASEIPLRGRLTYDACYHIDHAMHYPYCAIGVARERGEFDCAWRGDDVLSPRGDSPSAG